MSKELTVLGISAAITAGIQLTGFCFAYALQTETFYDILGGINFLSIGIYSFIDGSSSTSLFSSSNETPISSKKLSSTILFLISRSWLLLFLAWRAHERKGDSRFDEMKTKFFSFLIAWIFQGLWVFIISLSLIYINGEDSSTGIGGNGNNLNQWSVFEYVMIVGFGLGVIIEIIADIQKAMWVKAGRNGVFCKTGLWKYSRHPNYFGEIFQWWCLWLFAFGSTTNSGGVSNIQWWISILSPLFTMQILLNTPATGVYNANNHNSLKRYYDRVPEEYQEYRNNTSILIPLPLGIYKYVPMALKRTIFFDFKMYEYDGEIARSDGDRGGNGDSYDKAKRE